MPSTTLELTEDFLEEAHLASVASEDVDFRLRLGGGSSSSSSLSLLLLLLPLVELAFEGFPLPLLVRAKKMSYF